MDKRMAKSRGNTDDVLKGISPAILDALEDELKQGHTHDWQYARQIESRNTFLLKFVCHCGAAKYPEQFEADS